MAFPILRCFFSHHPSNPVFYIETVKQGNGLGVGGGGGVPPYISHRYVRPQMVGFLSCFGLQGSCINENYLSFSFPFLSGQPIYFEPLTEKPANTAALQPYKLVGSSQKHCILSA